ncbi:MAG: hypothetical protein QG599_1848 [Pseudomonadota bacterium]|nr:hypothetical protein [Pseudomonadota bacterium]
MVETSIADAKARLTRLIYQAEQGQTIHITRRGKSVAVLLSEDEYARLHRGQSPSGFWDLIVAMRSAPGFAPVDWSPEEIDAWRDRRPSREFEWPG